MVTVDDEHILRTNRYLANPVIGRLVSHKVDECSVAEPRLHAATAGGMDGKVEPLPPCGVSAGAATTIITTHPFMMPITHPFMMPAKRSHATKQRSPEALR